MAKTNKKNNNKFNKKLEQAILQIENYITNLNPRTIKDLKSATKEISTAALGAYLSVHSNKEATNFINQITHTFTDDVQRDLKKELNNNVINMSLVPNDYLDTIH